MPVLHGGRQLHTHAGKGCWVWFLCIKWHHIIVPDRCSVPLHLSELRKTRRTELLEPKGDEKSIRSPCDGGNNDCILDVDYQGCDWVLYSHLRQMSGANTSNALLGH
jgi:hypothetical protein